MDLALPESEGLNLLTPWHSFWPLTGNNQLLAKHTTEREKAIHSSESTENNPLLVITLFGNRHHLITRERPHQSQYKYHFLVLINYSWFLSLGGENLAKQENIRWSKYWSFSFSISPSNEYSGLIAVQGTLKSLLQHHSSKASIPWRSAFFKAQLPPPYVTTGKTIALTRWTFVGKVMSLLFYYAV